MKIWVASGVLVAGLIGGGIYLFANIEQMHQKSTQDFQNFGYKVVPLADAPVRGRDGAVATNPANLPPPKLTQEQQQIQSLQLAKMELSAKVEELQAQVIAYQQELKDLREQVAVYQLPNNSGALSEQRLAAYFEQLPEYRRFDEYQRELSIMLTYQSYIAIAQEYGLLLTERKRTALLQNGLSLYAFCAAEGVDIVANNRAERVEVKNYLQGKESKLSRALQEDVVRALLPCKQELDSFVEARLMAAE